MNIKLLTETAKLPTRGSNAAAGYDLYADIDEALVIQPHMTLKISTGIAIELPDNTWGAILPRSGLATKRGLRPANTPGCIDADYRGPVIVALHNDTDSPQIVEPQERIAQLVVVPYVDFPLEVVESLGDTARGDGGFGSTGTH